MVKGYGNRKYNFSHGPDFGQMYNNNNSIPTSNDTDLNEWELRILPALKSSSKDRKKDL